MTTLIYTFFGEDNNSDEIVITGDKFFGEFKTYEPSWQDIEETGFYYCDKFGYSNFSYSYC